MQHNIIQNIITVYNNSKIWLLKYFKKYNIVPNVIYSFFTTSVIIQVPTATAYSSKCTYNMMCTMYILTLCIMLCHR